MILSFEEQVACERLAHALYGNGDIVSWHELQTLMFMSRLEHVSRNTRESLMRGLDVVNQLRVRKEFTNEDLPLVDNVLNQQNTLTKQMIKPDAYRLAGERCLELDIAESMKKYSA